MDTEGVLTLMREVSARVVEPRFRALAEGQVDEKHPGDYVTVADREAEVELTRGLTDAFPGCVVVGEEATFADPEREHGLDRVEHLFVVDPIDGTANFVHGNPDHALMVAEARRGTVTRSWILQPALGVAYVCEQGAGLWRNGERVTWQRAHAGRPAGLSSRERWWHVDGEGTLEPTRPAFMSCGIDYPVLAEGRYDFAYYPSLHPWDHAPGTLMVRETGGVARMLDDGADYAITRLAGPLLVAGAEELWQQVAAVWPWQPSS